MPVAEFQAVRQDAFNAQVPRERSDNMIEALANQDQAGMCSRQGLNLLHPALLQSRLQHVMEILFSQQVQPVFAEPAQARVEHPKGKSTTEQVEEREQ